MKNRSPYISFAVISAILVVFFGLAWVFLIHKSYSMKADIASVLNTSNKVASRNAYLNSLKTTLEDSKSDLQVIDGRFVTKDGIPALIDSIDAMALSSGVAATIGSINLEDKSDSNLRTLHIHITGSGSWKGDIGFISNIENLPYAARVENLSLSAQKGATESASNLWSFSTDATIYVTN